MCEFLGIIKSCNTRNEILTPMSVSATLILKNYKRCYACFNNHYLFGAEGEDDLLKSSYLKLRG